MNPDCNYYLIKKNLSIKFFFLFFILLFKSYSQPILEWDILYPGNTSFDAGASDLTLDNLGNIYCAGYTVDFNPTLNGYCTIKYSKTGKLLWEAHYYGINVGGRLTNAIALDDSFNVFVTGYSSEPGNFFDFCTIKYDPNGIQQWIKFFNLVSSGEDEGEKIAVDKAGNIYVSGYTEQLNGGFAYTTIKYSTLGEQLWVRVYPYTSGNTHVTGIKTDDSCNIYITGDYETSAITIKYDSSGTQLWSHQYSALPIGGTTGAKDLSLDRFNNVYITGYANQSRFFTIKYSSEGILAWERRYNSDTATGGRYVSNSIAVDSFGNVYSSGWFQPTLSSNRKACIIKYSASGDTLFIIKDTASLGSFSTSMSLDINDNIYITGTGVIPRQTYLIIKYNALGNEMWRKIYGDVSTESYPKSIIVDRNNNVILTGSVGNNMGTIKYSQPVGIEPIYTNLTYRYNLYQNFPNPFNPNTRIKFEIPMLKEKSEINTKILIFDILGREIELLINQNLKSGIYEVAWNASKCPSGIYFYKLITEDYIQSKKMILIK